MDRLAQSASHSVALQTSAPITGRAWISQDLKEQMTVISAGKIRDALPEDRKQAPDLLIIRGPDTSDHWMNRVIDTAIRKGLTVHILGKPADGISMLAIDEYKNKFSSSGATHTWLLGHGSRQEENHQITIDANAGAFNTLDIVKYLRTGTHSGPAHIFSCAAGKLRGMIENDKELSESGLVILHSSGKAIWDDADISNAIEVVEHIGDCKSNSIRDDAYHLAARLAAVAGDSITLVGGVLKKSLLIRAPASTEEATPEYLLSVLAKKAPEGGKQFVECSSPDSLLQFSKVFKENIDRHKNLLQTKSHSMLITRIGRGDDSAVLCILEKNLELAKGSPDHRHPPIYHAIFSNSSDAVIEKLLANGASLDWKSHESGINMIHAAIIEKNTRALHRLHTLLSANGESSETALSTFDQMAETKNNDGNTALHLVAEGGSPEMLDLFLLDFESISQINNLQQNTIHLAAQSGDTKAIQKLLDSLTEDEAKKLVNRKDQFGNTPLHYAAIKGDVQMIRKLRGIGASRKRKNNDGDTPLRLAKKALDAGDITRFGVYGEILNFDQ